MSGRRKKKKDGGPTPPAGWLTTYGDMTTLLLTFFVLMFTTATTDGEEFRLILSAFRGSLGMLQGGMTLSHGRLEELGMTIESLPAQEKGRRLAQQLKNARSMFKPEIESDQIRVYEDERGLIITLANDKFFESGSADINPRMYDVLNKIATLFKSSLFNNKIRIEGHTDNRPVAEGSPYSDNWDLSSARAGSVLRYLIEKNVSDNLLSMVGYGEHRPLPGNHNRTPEERAQNRRVEIVVIHEEQK